MDGHLGKPFDMDGLLAAVARAGRSKSVGGRNVGSADAVRSILQQASVMPMPGADLPILDPIVFACVASRLAPDAVVTYLRTVAEQARSLRPWLHQTAALRGAEDELAEVAHALAGCAGMFGFERLATLCRRFERAIQSGAADVPVLADALSVTIKATLPELLQHM